MDSRKDTTQKLLELVKVKTSKPGVYGAAEVAVDWGTDHVRYVDYMTFSPANTVHVSGVEKGIFTCYEIKSCYADLYSGKGLNFIGEKNYLVTTAETYRKMQDDVLKGVKEGKIQARDQKLGKHIRSCNPESKYRIGYDVGVYVAVPAGRSVEDEIENPTAFEDVKTWDLKSVLPCYETTRTRSMTEMLFLMLKASSR